MKHIVILGAGGMGRQLTFFISQCEGYQTEYDIKGFIDDNLDALNGFAGYPPVLDTFDGYIIEEGDCFVNSIGDVRSKIKSINSVLKKGGSFISLIHPTACISANVKMGIGCIISSRAGIGVNATVGDFSFIQDNAIIGHDVKVGKWARIDCNVVCIAGVEVGDEVCIHTGAIINHNVRIGNGAIVGAGSFVIRDVKDGVTVYGNPARQL